MGNNIKELLIFCITAILLNCIVWGYAFYHSDSAIAGTFILMVWSIINVATLAGFYFTKAEIERR